MIRIETQPMSLKPIDGRLMATISDQQKIYLEQFAQNKTVAQTVQYLLQQGRLVSFTELYDLVEQLYRANLIQNPIFTAYFQKIEDFENKKVDSSLKSKVSSFLGGGANKKEKAASYLNKHPFFRTQTAVVTQLFVKHAEYVEVKAGTTLCQTGLLERDIYFMIEGEAAVYKNVDGQRRLLTFYGKDAVIGEIGFFMGELRTADVVCTKPCKIVVIRYDEAAFGRIINKDIAKNLQARFRVLHALAKSPFLKNIPEEALDSLMFAGRIRQAKEFEVLTKENDIGDCCYIIISGSVVITKGTKNVNVLGPGEAFGEIALFFTQGRRTATAMSQRDSTLVEIHASDFYQILAENLLLAREFEKLAFARATNVAAA